MLRPSPTWTPNNQGRAVGTPKGSIEQDRRGSSPHAEMPMTSSCRQHKCAYQIARVGFAKAALKLRLRHSISGVELSYRYCRRNISVFSSVQPCFTIYLVLVLLQPPGRLYSLQRYLASLRIMRRFAYMLHFISGSCPPWIFLPPMVGRGRPPMECNIDRFHTYSFWPPPSPW